MAFSDAILEKVEFSIPQDGEPGKLRVSEPEGNMIIAFVLYSISWFGLSVCAKAVAQKHGFSIEEIGFEYPTDLEPGDEVFEGVRIYAMDDEMFVTEKAFDRFMLSYFDFMINLAEKKKRPEMSESWWDQYMTYVEVIRARAQ